MISIIIDEITNCLKDVLTGEIFETEVHYIKNAKSLTKYNSRTGWHVNWSKLPTDAEIYGLCIKGDDSYQGLIALKDDKEADAVYIYWACASPENDIYFNGKRKYYGIGGHLIAIAAEKSVEYGHDGFIHAEAMDRELLAHFCEGYGAVYMPLPNKPTHFFMDEEAVDKIRKEYDYEWSK